MTMNKLSCGCIPDASGYGYCSECTRKLREKIWRELTPAQRDYDRQFAPIQSGLLDEFTGYPDRESCSCHINPPCSYCINKSKENEND
jgi:hypothetical protein